MKAQKAWLKLSCWWVLQTWSGKTSMKWKMQYCITTAKQNSIYQTTSAVTAAAAANSLLSFKSQKVEKSNSPAQTLKWKSQKWKNTEPPKKQLIASEMQSKNFNFTHCERKESQLIRHDHCIVAEVFNTMTTDELVVPRLLPTNWFQVFLEYTPSVCFLYDELALASAILSSTSEVLRLCA